MRGGTSSILRREMAMVIERSLRETLDGEPTAAIGRRIDGNRRNSTTRGRPCAAVCAPTYSEGIISMMSVTVLREAVALSECAFARAVPWCPSF